MLATISNMITQTNTINAICENNDLLYVIDKNSIVYFIEQLDIITSKISLYQALTLFITTIGIIINFLVVRTALLQYKRKLSLEISAHVQFPVGVGIKSGQQLLLFSLIVKNKGYCCVKLCQWGYTIDKRTKFQIVELKNKRFPIEILSYDTYTFQIPMKSLLDAIKKNIDEKKISKKVLYFYVLDGVGNSYYVKMKEKVDDFLKRAYEGCKDDKWDFNFY